MLLSILSPEWSQVEAMLLAGEIQPLSHNLLLWVGRPLQGNWSSTHWVGGWVQVQFYRGAESHLAYWSKWSACYRQVAPWTSVIFHVHLPKWMNLVAGWYEFCFDMIARGELLVFSEKHVTAQGRPELGMDQIPVDLWLMEVVTFKAFVIKR